MDFFDGWLSFSGRISRKTYILRCLFLYLLSFLLGNFYGRVNLMDILASPMGHKGIVFTLVIMLWIFYAAVNRRWHDLGKSSLWTVVTFLLASVVPLFLIALAYLACKNGDEGPNEYGPDPRN